MQNSILAKKDPTNVPKLSINMPPQVEIPGFPLETSFMLHLIQLWLGKHQLNCMTLGAEGGLHLIPNHLIIVSSWIEE